MSNAVCRLAEWYQEHHRANEKKITILCSKLVYYVRFCCEINTCFFRVKNKIINTHRQQMLINFIDRVARKFINDRGQQYLWSDNRCRNARLLSSCSWGTLASVDRGLKERLAKVMKWNEQRGQGYRWSEYRPRNTSLVVAMNSVRIFAILQ